MKSESIAHVIARFPVWILLLCEKNESIILHNALEIWWIRIQRLLRVHKQTWLLCSWVLSHNYSKRNFTIIQKHFFFFFLIRNVKYSGHLACKCSSLLGCESQSTCLRFVCHQYEQIIQSVITINTQTGRRTTWV